MGQLTDDYSIAQDGTIVRKKETEAPKGKSRGTAFVISILILCLIFGGFLVYVFYNSLKGASYYANNMNQSFSYPTWQSNNHRDNSVNTKEYTLAFDYGDELEVRYSVSSEKDYDVMTITLISPDGDENVLCRASGIESETIYKTIWSGGVYRLKVKYKKDGSYNRNGDVASIDGLYVRKNNVIELRHKLDW